MSETVYVVVARFGMDDIPMRLFKTRDEAEKWCNLPEAAQEANWTAVGSGIAPSWAVTSFSVCRFEQGLLAAIEVVVDVEDAE